MPLTSTGTRGQHPGGMITGYVHADGFSACAGQYGRVTSVHDLALAEPAAADEGI
ncbi:MAG TPA: hypothetical protein VGY96_24595 [Streptosporangiaceae bacterium]|jgi:hypothetical protein|nr:hypothetical protein [Streptosporangiaceae bacterium]